MSGPLSAIFLAVSAAAFLWFSHYSIAPLIGTAVEYARQGVAGEAQIIFGVLVCLSAAVLLFCDGAD